MSRMKERRRNTFQCVIPDLAGLVSSLLVEANNLRVDSMPTNAKSTQSHGLCVRTVSKLGGIYPSLKSNEGSIGEEASAVNRLSCCMRSWRNANAKQRMTSGKKDKVRGKVLAEQSSTVDSQPPGKKVLWVILNPSDPQPTAASAWEPHNKTLCQVISSIIILVIHLHPFVNRLSPFDSLLFLPPSHWKGIRSSFIWVLGSIPLFPLHCEVSAPSTVPHSREYHITLFHDFEPLTNMCFFNRWMQVRHLYSLIFGLIH